VCLSGFTQVLDTPVSFHAKDVRLSAALREISKQSAVPFIFDSKTLRQFKVSADVDSVQMESLLGQWLAPIGYRPLEMNGAVAIVTDDRPATNERVEPERSEVTIYGRVRSADALEPLPFASVTMPGIMGGTLTDENGYFSLPGVPTDTNTIVVSYLGFYGHSIQLTPTLAKSPIEVLLDRSRNLLPVATIETKSPKRRLIADEPSTQTIDVNLAATLPHFGEPDPVRMLQLLPGVSGTLESSGAFHIRGGATDENLVMLDGFTIYYLDHFYGNFSAFNNAAIKHVRIHKGVLDARFGGRGSSVLEITAKQGNLLTSSGKLDVSPTALSATIETPILAQRASMMISLRRSLVNYDFNETFQRLSSQFINNSSISETTDQTDLALSDFRFFDGLMKIGWESKKGDRFSFTGYMGNDRLVLETEQITGDERYEIANNDNSSWGTTAGGFSWDKRWKPGISSQMSIGLSDFKSELYGYDASSNLLTSLKDTLYFDRNSGLRDVTLRFQLNYRRKYHQLSAGWNATRYNLTNDRLNSRNEISRSTESASLFSLFFQDVWQKANYEFQGGARLSAASMFGGLFLEPRFRFRYFMAENWTLSGGAGRNVQFIRNVRQQDLFLNTADEWRLSSPSEIPVLKVDQATLSAHYNRSMWSLMVEGFIKNSRGVVDDRLRYPSIMNPDDTVALIRGDGFAGGVELLFSLNRGNHTGWISYTLSRTILQSDDLEAQSAVARYDRPNELKVVYSYTGKKWSYGLVFAFADGLPYTPVLGTYTLTLVNGEQRTQVAYGDVSAARLPAYHRLDLSLKRFWEFSGSKLSVGASVYNAYNRINVRNRYYLLNGVSSDVLDIGTRDLVFLGVVPSLNLSFEW
jgi:hypothetical protein